MATLSIARSTRRLLILLQAHQQLPKLRLLTTTRTPTGPLPTQIHQLRNTLPARATSRRILPTLQELLGLAAGGGNALLLLGVVVLVEVVDVLLGCLDCLCLALGGSGFALLQGEVPAFAPLLDYFGLFFFVGARGVVGWLLGLEGVGVGDAAAWCYTLDVFVSIAYLPPYPFTALETWKKVWCCNALPRSVYQSQGTSSQTP